MVSVSDILEGVTFTSAAIVAFTAVRLVMYARALRAEFSDAEPAPVETCRGYHSEFGSHRDDCVAIRSAFCLDGRCRYHCGEACRCEALYPPPPRGDGPYR